MMSLSLLGKGKLWILSLLLLPEESSLPLDEELCPLPHVLVVGLPLGYADIGAGGGMILKAGAAPYGLCMGRLCCIIGMD